MTDFFSKPVSEITFADIEALVAEEKEEGARFELKEQLSGSNNEPDPWMNGKKLGDIAKKKLAKEIVAFANTYGGVIVVGIKESSDKPPRASQIFSPLIPRVHNLAEVLTDCFHNIIDPPISNLITRGIEKDKSGNGVIFIKVEASLRAPHAVKDKHNLAVYVRQGASSIPMTMRNIQSLFFEIRSRAERLKNMREEQSEKFHEFCDKTYKKYPDLCPGSLAFRCTIIPVDNIGICREIINAISKSGFERVNGELFPYLTYTAFGLNDFTSSWKTIIKGAKITEINTPRCVHEWTVMSNGLIEACGIHKYENGHSPLWYVPVVAQLIIWFHRLRKKSALPDMEAIIDCEILNPYSVKTNLHDIKLSRDERCKTLQPQERSLIGPYNITSLNQYNNIYSEIEKDICNAFGVVEHLRYTDDIDDYISNRCI